MRIKQELDAHTFIEETIFYPHCLRNGDEELQKIVREGLQEHRQVKLFLAEMNNDSAKDPAFKAKMTVMIEDVEHHVEEEEGEMFDMAEEQFDTETLSRLGAQMQEAKQQFMSQTSRAASAQ